jgi:TonB-dependent receptor
MTNFDRVVGLMGASVVAIACASPAMAQTRTYSIPAQSASSGVAALARQSDQQVLISARDAKGKKTREVRGEMTIEQAFAKLLAGSGLTAKRTGAGAWAVVQGGNGDAAPARTEASASGTNLVAVPPASASTVVDARTGAALKGALVEIVETGEKTSTGDLGEFRFPGKTGSYNLRISYLGYPQYEQFVDLANGRATTGILLSDGSSNNEIIVTAYQSGRAQALNQERTAENTSTVVSADLLGQFDGNTISDSLRRVSGVSFAQDPITGDGSNIAVRGMNAQFNTVTLNGLRLPVGDGQARSASLSNILADSVSKITLNKTLLPNQDGTGTGALIDIETKGPLDRPKRYFNVSGDFAKSADSFLDEKSLAATGSMRFGADGNFGLSVSAQYRDRNATQVNVGNTIFNPEYLPLMDGSRVVMSTDDIDPRRMFPFEPGVDKQYAQNFNITRSFANVKNLAIGLAAQWQIGQHTNLRLDYNWNRATTKSEQITTNIYQRSAIVPVPIDELNGEVRYAHVWEDATGDPGLVAAASMDGLLSGPIVDKSSVLSFQGTTNVGKWEFEYNAGMTLGTNSRTSFGATSSQGNFTLTREHLSAETIANTTDGRIVSLFPAASGTNVSLPGLSQAGYDYINNNILGNYSFGTASKSDGRNERYKGSFDVKYNIGDSIFRYIQAGVFFERSKSENNPLLSTFFFGSPTLAEIGLGYATNSFSDRVFPSGLASFDRPDLFIFRERLLAREFPQISASTSTFDDLTYQDSVTENNLAGYVQTSLQFGKLEVVGGARWERVTTIADAASAANVFDVNFVQDVDFAARTRVIERITDGRTSFLPRVAANYRFSENLILRLGYYKSYARPSITALGSSRNYTLYQNPGLSPNGDRQTLFVNVGNPDLKPSVTDNFDVSLEWYDRAIGVIKLGAFYKPTSDPFFAVTSVEFGEIDTAVLPDDPRFQSITSDNTYISYSIPINAPDKTKLWGIEASVERKFEFLPGLLKDFGIFSNFTWTDSEQTIYQRFFVTNELLRIKSPYSGQPRHSGTVALTYSRAGLDASLGYTWQARRLGSWANFGLDSNSEAVDSLDFKMQYSTKLLGNPMRLYFEGSDLLKGPEDSSINNTYGNSHANRVMASERYFGGRVFRLGASYSF